MKSTDNIKDKLKLSPKADAFILCLYYVLACTYVPLCSFLRLGETAVSFISLIVCALSIVAMSRAAGSFKAVIGYAVILGIFIFLGGGLTVVGIFAAFATAVCVYSHLLLKSSSPILWGVPAIPFAIALLTSGTAISAILALAPLPAAIMLTWAMKSRAGRVGAICRISTGLCLVVVAVFLCFVHSVHGEITFASCKATVDALKTYTTDLALSVMGEVEGVLGAEAALVNAEELMTYAVGVMFNTLPAVIIIFANIVSYVIHSMMMSVEYVSLEDKKDAMPMMTFEMSIISAIVFILSLVLTFVLTEDVYKAVAENVMLILMPGLILTALGGLRALSSRKGPSCLGAILYVVAIFMIATFNAVVLITASAVGAVLIIISNIVQSKSDK